jgi:hypothetical protein
MAECGGVEGAQARLAGPGREHASGRRPAGTCALRRPRDSPPADGFRACATQPSRSAQKGPTVYTAKELHTGVWHHCTAMPEQEFYWSPVPASPVKHPCPCCGYQTLREPPPGTWQTCQVCWWTDDPEQFENPTFDGGPNHVSLRQARKNFRRHGVSDKRLRHLARLPHPDEQPRLRSYYD